MTDPAELLRELVGVSSVSRESNHGVISVAEVVLAQAGWRFRQYAYVDALGVVKTNLVAWPSQNSADDMHFRLALVCHTDTVPYSTNWADATKLIEDGPDLKGCGACDVKGFLACILAVAATIDAASLTKPLCIVLTADEEIGCLGARHLVESQALRADYAIIGEPTSLQPISAGKGYCLAEVTVNGREAHSAFPDNGKSAIFGAARLIVEIEKIAEQLKEFRRDNFSPPWTTLNVGEIQGGLAKNIVPPACRFLLEWRPVADQDPEFVLELVRGAVQRLEQLDPLFHCELKVLRVQEGFVSSPDSELLMSLIQATGKPPASVAFGTEAPWLQRLGAETVVFGPGSMNSAHSPREFVPREELYRCMDVLTEAIYNLCR
ncbi:Acetylornithine deacetylase [Acidisarcina polymorpha]|uniref:Acetylornithine deacetylase n=1 Tax=Acidisarcina polymorpha TaxID=2211140 RepID=A0A2Z5FY34_9BACT|nr:acetylornithine deacetylase [Acidisarcina polymorpha]AXC11771.1 Acetylornithine deacetylase [Acidisarcina polymorpha]